MGKAAAVVEKNKKKKGRPSLSDLQKRQPFPPLPPPPHQQPQDKKRNPNPNHGFLKPNPNSTPRRITRSYVSLVERKGDEEEEEEKRLDDDDDDDNDDDDERKREKKLKVVLKLARSFHPRSPSSLGNSDDRTAEGEVPGSVSNDESESGEQPVKKRKIDSVSETKKPIICNESVGEKGNRRKNDQNGDRPTGRAPSGSLTTQPLPNAKLLFFILERLQKKDTYGVFSEPVDPQELPDYQDVIEHPMDFSTVKKKLTTGVYTTLEQFESDVFLICSNAMQYNAPDTIYFRQARSIQELAKKNFSSLRQDSDGTEQDAKPQRGRPSLFKKFMQQSVAKPPVESTASHSDAVIGNAGRDNSTWPNKPNNSAKKISVAEKPSSFSDVAGRATLSFRNSDMSTPLTENKFEKNGEVSGHMLRVMNMRHGRKPFVSEENHRETYKISDWSAGRRDPVLGCFNIENKQLIPVGLHMGHAYAWSLARFAASLGPVAWNVAARKIERALPPGIRFGPGWIGESEAPPSRQSPVKTAPDITTPAVIAPTVDPKSDVLEVHDPSNKPVWEGHINPKISPGQPNAVNGNARASSKENSNSLFNPGMHDTQIPFQHHQNSGILTSPNGFMSGVPLPPSVKQAQVSLTLAAVRSSRPQEIMGLTSSQFSVEAVTSVHLADMVSRNSSISRATPSKLLDTEQPRTVDGKVLTHSSNNARPGNTMGPDYTDDQVGFVNGSHQQKSWRGLSLHRKSDSVPPDLNIGFQSPSSPVRQNSGVLVDSQQPDLALQL